MAKTTTADLLAANPPAKTSAAKKPQAGFTPQKARYQIQNVRNVYDATPQRVRDAGMHWYDNVNDAVTKGVRGTSMSVHHGAGLVAAVSPNMDWEKNNIHAFRELHSLRDRDFHAIAHGDRSSLQGMSIAPAGSDAVGKAHRIMQGEHPDAVLTAPKTNSFYHNIAEPQSAGRVTIDGRAHDIANNAMRPWKEGRPISGDMYTPKGQVTAAHQRYNHYENVYRRAAGVIEATDGHSMLPHQLQAVTWEGGKHIERSGLTKAGKPRQQGPARKGQGYV